MSTALTLDALLEDADFLRRLAHSLAPRGEAADDLVQETHLATLERRGEVGSPRRWAAGIMRRRVAGLLRRREVERRHQARIARADVAPSTEDLLQREELRQRVANALLSLKEPYRGVLVLRYYEGLSPREVARRLDTPIETIRTRQKRGLRQMREKLDAHYGSRRGWSALVSATFGNPGTSLWLPVAGILTALVIAIGGVAHLLARPPGDGGSTSTPYKVADEAPRPRSRGPALRGPGASAVDRTTGQPRGTGVLRGHLMAGYRSVPGSVEARFLSADADESDLDQLALAAMARVPDFTGTARAGRGFEIEGVGRGHYIVTAEDQSGRRYGRTAEVWAKGAAARSSIELPTSELTTTVQVHHADSSPYTGWVACLFGAPNDGGEQDWTFASTDGRGRAVLPHPPGFVILATHDGVHSRVGRINQSAGTVTLELEQPGDSGRCRVVDASSGSAIVGARIDTMWTRTTAGKPVGQRGASWSTLTDAKGTFLIRRPQETSLFITVDAEGYQRLRYDVEAHAKSPDELRIARLATLRGRVVDSVRGEPVRGARVRAIRVNEMTQELEHRDSTESTTDTNGDFVFDAIAPGRWMVYVHGAGWCSPGLYGIRREGRRPYEVSVPYDREEGLLLRATPTATVAGRVLGDDDRPVWGGRVTIHTNPRDVFSHLGSVVTNKNGRYSYAGLLPSGYHYVRVDVPGYANTVSMPFQTSASAPATVDLVLPREHHDRWLIIKAEDQHGRPYEGLNLNLRRSTGMRAPMAGVPTDARGVARLPRRTNEELILGWRVPAGRGRLHDSMVIAASDERVVRKRIVIERATTISGRVVVPDGARLFFVRLSAMAGKRPNILRIDNIPFDDKTGAFSFAADVAGPWRLLAENSMDDLEMVGPVQAMAGQSDVEIELARKRDVKTTRATPTHSCPWTFAAEGPEGQAVSACWIRFMRLDGNWSGSEMTRGKPIKLHATAAGTEMLIVADRARDATGRALPYGTGVVGPIRLGDQNRDVVVRLNTPRRLEGRVLVDGKAPPEGTAVHARIAFPSMQHEQLDAHDQTARTNAGGYFKFPALGPYRYALQVARVIGARPHAIQFVERTEKRVELHLRAYHSATVTVVDGSGTPIHGARVTAHATADAGKPPEADSGVTDATGKATLIELDSERTYRLRVDPPHASDHFGKTVPLWHPSDVEISLDTGSSITCRVHQSDGSPFPEAASVWAEALEGQEGGRRVRRLDETRYRIHAVRPGTYALRAAYGYLRSMPVEARAGDKNVTLTLDQGAHIRAYVDPFNEDKDRATVYWCMVRRSPDDNRAGRSGGSAKRDGIQDFPGVPLGASIAVIIGLDGDRVAFRSGIELLEAKRYDVPIPVYPARTIEGRVEGTHGEIAIRVFSPLLGRVNGWVTRPAADGTFRVSGLPPIELKAQIRELLDGEWIDQPPIDCIEGDLVVLRYDPPGK